MKKKKVPQLIKKRGKKIIEGWKRITKKNNLNIKTNLFYSMPTFYFDYQNDNETLHTLFTKYMLEKGYLATNYMFVTYSHNENEIKKYLKTCETVFKKIKKKISENKVPKNFYRKFNY